MQTSHSGRGVPPESQWLVPLFVRTMLFSNSRLHTETPRVLRSSRGAAAGIVVFSAPRGRQASSQLPICQLPV